MESMLIFGLIAVIAFVLRALLPAPSESSETIYVPVVVQEAPARGGLGCLMPVVIVIVVLVALHLLSGAV